MVAQTQSQAEALVSRLIPYTFGTAALTWLLTRNVTKAASVLMVDFSCAIEVAMPISVLSAMREASRHHITVKGGKFLELIAEADTIVFDKTGTLTRGCSEGGAGGGPWPGGTRTRCSAWPPAWKSTSPTRWPTRWSARPAKNTCSTRRCTPSPSTSWPTASSPMWAGSGWSSAASASSLRTRRPWSRRRTRKSSPPSAARSTPSSTWPSAACWPRSSASTTPSRRPRPGSSTG